MGAAADAALAKAFPRKFNMDEGRAADYVAEDTFTASCLLSH